MTLTATPLPLLSDNYAWVLASAGETAIVDPAEAGPVIAWCEAHKVTPAKILLTHHHADHIDGVPDLVARYGCKVVGAKADAHRLPPLDQAVAEGDTATSSAVGGIAGATNSISHRETPPT